MLFRALAYFILYLPNLLVALLLCVGLATPSNMNMPLPAFICICILAVAIIIGVRTRNTLLRNLSAWVALAECVVILAVGMIYSDDETSHLLLVLLILIALCTLACFFVSKLLFKLAAQYAINNAELETNISQTYASKIKTPQQNTIANVVLYLPNIFFILFAIGGTTFVALSGNLGETSQERIAAIMPIAIVSVIILGSTVIGMRLQNNTIAKYILAFPVTILFFLALIISAFNEIEDTNEVSIIFPVALVLNIICMFAFRALIKKAESKELSN